MRESSFGFADVLTMADGDATLILGLRRQKVSSRFDGYLTGICQPENDYDEAATTDAIGTVLRPSRWLAPWVDARYSPSIPARPIMRTNLISTHAS